MSSKRSHAMRVTQELPGTSADRGSTVGGGIMSSFRDRDDPGGGGAGATQVQSLAASRAADSGVTLGGDALATVGEQLNNAGGVPMAHALGSACRHHGHQWPLT